MFTDEFKSQMREFLKSVFNERTRLLYSPYSMADDLIFNDSTFILTAPIIVGQELLSFFESEGLQVEQIAMGMYSISPVL